jgi:hypothetical protein
MPLHPLSSLDKDSVCKGILNDFIVDVTAMGFKAKIIRINFEFLKPSILQSAYGM